LWSTVSSIPLLYFNAEDLPLVVCDCIIPPPYSPDFNPIEEAFSFIKSILFQNGAEFWAAVDSKNMNVVQYLLHNMLNMITLVKAQGWMGHSGYLCTETV